MLPSDEEVMEASKLQVGIPKEIRDMLRENALTSYIPADDGSGWVTEPLPPAPLFPREWRETESNHTDGQA